MQRFADVIVHARFKALLAVATHRAGRHGYDRRMMPRIPLARPQNARRREPVHFRHVDVHQHQVHRGPFQFLECFETRRRDINAMPIAFKRADYQTLVHRVVLGEQNPQRT